MSYEVLEGQSRLYRRHGTLASSVTSTVPEGQFLVRSGSGVEYTDIDTTPPAVVFMNLVDSDREDCVDGGLALLQGPFELITTVYDDTATFTLHAAVSVKKVGASVSGLITMSTAGEYIHGWVLEVPAAGNGNKLRVALAATNDGLAS